MKKVWFKVWVYIVILLIVILTIIGMIFISNNVNISFKNAELVNNIINEEAVKQKEDYPWVYDYTKDKKVLIPYININSKIIKKINDENIHEDLKDIKQTNYLYSINDNLLSILYTKEYEDKIEYKIYNINLKTSKLMNNQEVLNLFRINYDNLYDKVLLSCELYLKNKKYANDIFETYLEDTNKYLRENGFDIYVGNNKELYVLVYIFREKLEPVLIPIMDI